MIVIIFLGERVAGDHLFIYKDACSLGGNNLLRYTWAYMICFMLFFFFPTSVKLWSRFVINVTLRMAISKSVSSL